MSLRERQKVTYFTMSFSYLSALANLSKPALQLFAQLVEHIDKKCNCLQVTVAQLTTEAQMSKDKVKRGLKDLMAAGLVKRDVVDIGGKARYMVNPDAYWSYGGLEREFALYMYHEGGHDAAIKLKRCLSGKVDWSSGELTHSNGRPWLAKDNGTARVQTSKAELLRQLTLAEKHIGAVDVQDTYYEWEGVRQRLRA